MCRAHSGLWQTSVPRAVDPPRPALQPDPDNRLGGMWLLADMALNIWSLSIVKALGLGYASSQIVFLRALVGMVLMAPWVWRRRADFVAIADPGLHLLRVVFATGALTLNFYAMPRLQFALVSAIGFTRPALMMILAALVLGERISLTRWLAAAVAFVGVLIALNPGQIDLNWAVPAMFGGVLCGVAAVTTTRRLRAAPVVVLMGFYTLGLTAFSAPMAWLHWTPIASQHLLALLSIGVFAQCAQFCFLNAHRLAEASFLGILGYLSLILSTSVGYLVFDEVPSPGFWIGAALILGAASVLRTGRPLRRGNKFGAGK